MWGHTIGDTAMEARGNLQLAITARALQDYYLLDSSNMVQPPEFIGVRAAGKEILFDRLVNHTTYFGDEVSFVQGIDMLPINPGSATPVKQLLFERNGISISPETSRDR